MKLIEKKKFKLFTIFLGFILGIFSIYFFGDDRIANEWGVMLRNYEEHDILSIRKVEGVLIPNVFMPPLYVYFLFSIKKIFFFFDNFLIIVHSIQLFLYILSIIVFNKTLRFFYSNFISNIGVFIFALFPLYIYSISQISSISLQVFLICVFINYFVKFFYFQRIKHIILFSISSGLLILLRGEFFVFVIFSIAFYLLDKKKIREVIISFIIIILTISPYLIRNYNLFDTLVITKSAGYNLLKGNNPLAKVEGVPMLGIEEKISPEIEEELKNLEPSEKYDLLVDKIFFNQAIKNIKEDPKKYFLLYIKKALSFVFIDLDSSYPGYYSVLNILPKLIISLTTVISILMIFNFKLNLLNYFIIYYILNIALFSVFFILPRYSLSLLPIQIILSMYLFKKILRN